MKWDISYDENYICGEDAKTQFYTPNSMDLKNIKQTLMEI